MNKTNITLKQGMIALVITVAALIVGFGLPSWQFLITVALAKGLVALGVVLLLRSGLASFGQGLYYCIGAYGVGMAMNYLDWREALVLLLHHCAILAMRLLYR